MAKGDLIATEANKRAGEALLEARERLGGGRSRPMSQPQFIELLAKTLDLELAPSQSAYSEWEGGRSTVPAAILIAASQVLSARKKAATIDELVIGAEAFWEKIRENVVPMVREELSRQQPPGQEPGGQPR